MWDDIVVKKSERHPTVVTAAAVDMQPTDWVSISLNQLSDFYRVELMFETLLSGSKYQWTRLLLCR